MIGWANYRPATATVTGFNFLFCVTDFDLLIVGGMLGDFPKI